MPPVVGPAPVAVPAPASERALAPPSPPAVAQPAFVDVATIRAAAIAAGLRLPPGVYANVAAALGAGKHLLLIGTPGSGKTALAMAVARAAAQEGKARGATIVTGDPRDLVPEAAAQGRWVIVDELDQIDPATTFAPLSSFLGGVPVTFAHGEATPTEHWRLIATWNGAEPPRAAILRRFAVIEVHGPASDELRAAIKHAANNDATATAAAEQLVHYADRVGTGVLLDAARHAAARQAAVPTDPDTLAHELLVGVHRAADRAVTLRRTPQERAALERAKATLDTLDFYPEPVKHRPRAHPARAVAVQAAVVPALPRLRDGPADPDQAPAARVPAEPDRPRAVPRVAGPGPSPEACGGATCADGYATNPHEIEARKACSGGNGMTDEILTAIATARAFQQASGAQRVVVILDRPDEEPAMVEVDEFLDAEVTEGEQVVTVPHSTTIEQPAQAAPGDPPDAGVGDRHRPRDRRARRADRHGRAPRGRRARARRRVRRPHGRQRRVRHQRPGDADHARRPRRASASCSAPGEAQFEL